MTNYINTLSGCSKLKDRSLNFYGKQIKQNCSRKCKNALKKGYSFNSKKVAPSSDQQLNIRDSPNLCGSANKSSKIKLGKTINSIGSNKNSKSRKYKSRKSKKNKSIKSKKKGSSWWPF